MNVLISDRQKDLPLKHERKKIAKIVESVVDAAGACFQEVSISFITDPAMRLMHKKYFNDPSSTDCISFPLDEENEVGYKILGELYICPKAALEYSAKKKNDPDPYQETTLYIVHGLLHCLGYDDVDPTDRKEMRRAEKRHLQILKKKGLILNGI